jgi:type II secretory pathway pseudopilin PulG
MSDSKTRGNSPRKTLKFLLLTQLKRSKQAEKASGFTLLELLVALILAFLIITPLLGFVINIMNTDRQQQAKATSEQELQAAADYITRDLQQAVHIYDADGLKGIKSQLPSGADQVPVLVFWKRRFVEKALPIQGKAPSTCIATPKDCDDVYVYSLVAYYLVIDKSTPTWPGPAQIGRFEIHDGLKDAKGNDIAGAKVTRDPGFNFDLTKLKGDTIAQKLNKWRIGSDKNFSKTPVEILVDYIDATQTSQTKVPKENCLPPDPKVSDPQWQQVPAYTGPGAVNSQFQTYSFYACVYSSKNTAQVFLRGNALARIKPKNNVPKYDKNQAAFFPTASIEVTGSGGLGKN